MHTRRAQINEHDCCSYKSVHKECTVRPCYFAKRRRESFRCWLKGVARGVARGGPHNRSVALDSVTATQFGIMHVCTPY